MNSTNCEEIILAKMALLDGEESPVSIEKITAHTTECESCNRKIERLENAINLFAECERRENQADLWTKIEGQINRQTENSSHLQRKIFLALGAALIVYKLFEMLPANDLGFLFKFVPLIFAAGVFLLLRENPFKINTELGLER